MPYFWWLLCGTSFIITFLSVTSLCFFCLIFERGLCACHLNHASFVFDNTSISLHLHSFQWILLLPFGILGSFALLTCMISHTLRFLLSSGHSILSFSVQCCPLLIYFYLYILQAPLLRYYSRSGTDALKQRANCCDDARIMQLHHVISVGVMRIYRSRKVHCWIWSVVSVSWSSVKEDVVAENKFQWSVVLRKKQYISFRLFTLRAHEWALHRGGPTVTIKMTANANKE